MVSLLIQLIGILPGLGGLQPYLLSTQFNAWQGLLRVADRLGADRPRRVGLRAVRDPGADRRVPGVPAPRRRRWLTLARRAASGCWSSTTTRRCGGCSSARWRPRASRCAVAADGGAALVAAERSAPDVIVLDVAMPGLDGLDGVPAPARARG